MTHFYEKQGAGANGLGVTDKFPWQGSFAPSGTWQGGMPNLGAQQQQPNIFQQQLAPSSTLADVGGIQQAMQKFKKMGKDKQAGIGSAIGGAADTAFKNIKEHPATAVGGGLLGAAFPLLAAVLANKLRVKAPKLHPPSYTGKDPIRIGKLLKQLLPGMGVQPSPRADMLQHQMGFGGTLGALTAPQFEINKRGADMNNNESKFRNLMAKHAAQDNSMDSRSAAGEGKGVTFKTNDDDHATGTAAWESIGQYMKSANEAFFVPDGVKLANQANVDAYISGGMPARAAIKKAYPNWSSDQIDAFMSTYNKRAEDAKHDCDKEHPGVSHEEWEEKSAADELHTFMSSISQEKRASLDEFVRTSSTPGEAFELWMDKEGIDKKAAWEKLAYGWLLGLGRGLLAGGRAAGAGLARVPSMFRAGRAAGAATAAAKGSGKIMQGAKGLQTGIAAGGKQVSRTVLGRAPTGAGRFSRGTGIRGWAGRNPVTAVTTLPLVPGMVGGAYNAMTGGGGGQPGQHPAPRGGYGGGYGQGQIGYGTGGGQGVAPWQTHQQQPGHNPEGVAATMKDKPYKAACDKTGLTPYQLTFALRVHKANLSPQQIKAGIDKAGEYMGEEYVEELREGMDKIASMDKEAVYGWLRALGAGASKYGKPALSGLKNLFGKAPKGQADRLAHSANKLFQGTKGTGLAETTAKALKKIPKGVNQSADWSKGLGLTGGPGGLMRMAGGGMTGAQAAGDDAPWYVKAPAILGGAAFGRAMPNMGAGARAAGNRAMWGGFGGLAADEALGLGGIDTGGRLGQIGSIGGFASPLLKGQKIPGALTAGKYNPLKGLAGGKLPNLGFNAAGRRGGLGSKINQWAQQNPGWLGTKGLRAATFAPSVGAGVGAIGSSLAGAADDYVDGKVEGARQDSMNELMNNPQIQNALNMAQQGGGFMESLSGIGGIIDPLLEMMGMDPSQMNPLMKILLMAGGGLGLGGLLSGSKGAGIGGLGMMAIPLIAQMMKKNQGGGRVPPGHLGPGRAGLPADWRPGQVDPNRIAAGLEGGLGDITEMQKATENQ